MFHPVLTPAEFQRSLHPIVRVDAVAKIFRNKVLPTDLSGKQVLHYSIPNVQEIGTGKIEDGDTIDSDKWLITEEAVLISKLNPRKSTICLAAPQGGITVASTEFVVLSTGNSIDNRYIKYILESEIVRQFLTSRSTSATRSHQRVNPHDIIALGIPWPEESTRTKIVKELNRELAEIDKVIADTQQLEQLEQEHIVAERDWVFEKSETSVPLRYMAKFITSGSRGWGDYIGDIGSPFMRITNLQRNSIEPDLSNLLYVDTARLPSEEGKRSQLQVGDILISITANLGSVAVVDERIAGGYVSQHLALVRIDTGKYNPHAVAEAILSSRVKYQIDQKSYGGTKVQLSLEDVKELKIPLINISKLSKHESSEHVEIIKTLNELKKSLIASRMNQQ